MKRTIVGIVAGLMLGLVASAEMRFEFADVNDFTDFSLSGMSESKTRAVFEGELKRFAKDKNDKYLAEGEVLTVRFLDIDMAGDIQPWRNPMAQDIRYVESIYIPRIHLSYVLTDAEGNEVAKGEEKLTDLAFMNDLRLRVMQTTYSFPYELNLLEDWLRKLRPPAK